MSNEIVRLLLLLINNEGNSDPLISLGFSYIQIAMGIEYLTERGFISKDGQGTLLLSELGKQQLVQLNSKFKGGDKWILPDNASKIAQADLFDIYLPTNKTKLLPDKDAH
jgi:hypothetical protein